MLPVVRESLLSQIELRDNFKNDVSLETLSAHFHYDKYYFSKLFKKNYAESPLVYRKNHFEKA